MPLKVSWHKDALGDFLEIVEYFENEGLIMASENFRDKVKAKVDFINSYPGAGRPTLKHKNLRYILVDKHRRMYYRFIRKTLTILAFFDSRQDPSKRPF